MRPVSRALPFLGDTDPVPMLRREPSGVDVQIQSDGVMLRAKLPSRNTTGAVPGEQTAAGAKAGGGQGDGVLGLNSGFMCVRHQVALLCVTAMSCSRRAVSVGLRGAMSRGCLARFRHSFAYKDH